jgi:hypothetical protein
MVSFQEYPKILDVPTWRKLQGSEFPVPESAAPQISKIPQNQIANADICANEINFAQRYRRQGGP